MTIWSPELDPAEPVYRAIVDALSRDVARGGLADGDRLPTQRDLARHLGVSIGTVTRAYALAERRGLVRGEVGRGTFVGGEPLASLPVGDLAETVEGAVNLSMTWPLPAQDPELGPVLRALGRDAGVDELLGYQPNAGHPRHRDAGARWLERYGLSMSADRVVVTAGTQHAMTVALGTALRPGDVLLTEDVTYPGIRAVAEFLRLDLVGLPCDGEGLSPEAFEAACREKRAGALYTIPTLQNPRATTASLARREAIVRAARLHGVGIVEDGIHHLLDVNAPPTIASLAPELTTFLAAPSKVVAGGLRIGFLAAPRAHIDRIAHAVWSTTWMAAPLCAEIFARWIEDGTADETVARKRAEAAERVRLAREVLAGADVRMGEASYHAWLTVPEAFSSADSFAEEAARRGVLVTAASPFQAGRGEAPRAVRVSLSAPRSREVLAVGLERLAETLRGEPGPSRAIV